jgi:hypothetical protein
MVNRTDEAAGEATAAAAQESGIETK